MPGITSGFCIKHEMKQLGKALARAYIRLSGVTASKMVAEMNSFTSVEWTLDGQGLCLYIRASYSILCAFDDVDKDEGEVSDNTEKDIACSPTPWSPVAGRLRALLAAEVAGTEQIGCFLVRLLQALFLGHPLRLSI